MLRLTTILLALLIAVSGAAALVAQVGPPIQAPSQGATEQTEIEHQKEDTWWESRTKDPLALFTLWLAAFTGFLVLFTGGLLWMAHRQNQHFRQVERAFVFLRRFDVGEIRAIEQRNGNQVAVQVGRTVTPVLSNSGNTPTRRTLTRVNRYVGSAPLADDFRFLDHVDPGVPDIPRPTLIGPKSEILVNAFEFPNEVLTEIANGHLFAYLWGWIDYDDVFQGSWRHRTEFCHQIVVTGAAEVGWGIRTVIHNRFNGMDDECVRTPAPYRSA